MIKVKTERIVPGKMLSGLSAQVDSRIRLTSSSVWCANDELTALVAPKVCYLASYLHKPLIRRNFRCAGAICSQSFYILAHS